ncbi:MAG: helix-turn-helix domain-containing protein [Sulfuricella sp.]|nr:helix-turn-helix domain-containing protein [Sulfuricella sp.]
MDEKTEFAARLRDAMIAAGYEPRPATLEKGFNARYWGRSVTYQAVSRWLRGEAIPAQDKLQVLAEWLGVEPHLLRFGEKSLKTAQNRKKRWEEAIDFKEREVFDAYLRLPAAQQKIVREVILTFSRAYPEDKV